MTRSTALIAIFALLATAQTKLTPLDETAYTKVVSAHKGKVVVVDFWATWCKPCRAEMPQLVALESKLRSRGMKLITISADEPEQEAAALKFLTEMRVPSPAYLRKAKDDDKFINFVDAKWSGALPAMFIYDKSGRKAKTFFGEASMTDVEASILKLL